MRIVTIIALLILAAMATTALADELHEDVGTTAFAFTKIGVGARPVAMGGAFVGLADDITALYYNPAGLAGLQERQFVLGYHNYFTDIQSGLVGGAWKRGFNGTVAAYASYLNYGEFDATDEQGNASGETFGGGDILFAVAYAHQLNYSWQVGGAAKFIYEKLDEFTATGAAVDLGVRFMDNRERLSVGLAVQNLGAQFSSLGEEKDDMPMNVRGGLAYKPIGLDMTLTGDVIMPNDNDIYFNVGAEYFNLKPLYLRAGWSSFGSNYKAADSDDNWAGFTAGVGFDFRRMQISYALLSGAELGETHRITLTGGF